MKQEYINKIREACIKANPEIVELKFGCEVENIHGKIERFINNAGRERYRCLTDDDMFSEPLNIFRKEIIGRHIQLADIFIALNQKGIMYQFDGGNIIYFEDGFDSEPDQSWWNLKETLENQSEETLKFIADLYEKD